MNEILIQKKKLNLCRFLERVNSQQINSLHILDLKSFCSFCRFYLPFSLIAGSLLAELLTLLFSFAALWALLSSIQSSVVIRITCTSGRLYLVLSAILMQQLLLVVKVGLLILSVSLIVILVGHLLTSFVAVVLILLMLNAIQYGYYCSSSLSFAVYSDLFTAANLLASTLACRKFS